MTFPIKTLNAQAATVLRETCALRGAFGAGILLVCPHKQSILLGKRAGMCPEPNTWAPFGGTSELDEHPFQTATREHAEESGITIQPHDLTLLYATNRNGRFPFFTFLATINHEIEPHLDLSETQSYGWFRAENMPKPLHPGFQELVNSAQWGDVMKILQHADQNQFHQWSGE